MTDTPRGQVRWQLPWHDILTLEPRPAQNPSLQPDGIVIHRRGLDAPLQYVLGCRSVPQPTLFSFRSRSITL